MKLRECGVEKYTQVLASPSPAPGGGSASALMGAQGAALTAMVCALTLQKAALAPRHPLAESVQARAEGLRRQFLDLMERDTAAFLTVSAAYAMPRDSEEERRERSAAIQRGLALCTETPLQMILLACEGLELISGLADGFNESAASDLGVAVLSLTACARGAWFNVRINLGSLKDRDLAERCRSQGTEAMDWALLSSEALTRRIEACL